MTGAHRPPEPVLLRRHRPSLVSRAMLGVLTAGVLLPALAYEATAVRAAGLTSEPAAPPCTLCVLSSAGTSVQVSGNGELLVHWGSLVVDSQSSSAAQLSGNAEIQSSESDVVGGLQVSGNAVTQPAFHQVPKPGDADPYAALTEPTPSAKSMSYSASGTTKAAVSPGTYTSFSVSGQAVVTLQPGLYVITQSFQVSGQAQVSGSGVTLFFSGQSGMALSGGSTLHLTSPTSGADAGISVFFDRVDGSSISSSGNGSPSQRFLGGAVYAARGELGGSGTQELEVDDPVVVGQVALSGGGTILIDNVQAGQSVSGAKLSPQLSLGFGVSQQSAIPGDGLTYTATLTNSGSTLSVSGTVTAENSDTGPAVVAAYSDLLETASTGTCTAATDHGQTQSGWTSLASIAAAATGYTPVATPPSAVPITLKLTPVAASGVTYPTSGDLMLGTQIQAGATASWTFTATVALAANQVTLLLTSSQVAQDRDSFHVEVLPDGQQQGAGQLDTVNTEFCQLFQAGVSGAITNAHVTVTPPSGTAVTLGSSANAALASLAPGASATVTVPYTVPVPAAKGQAETDSAYLVRLQALEGKALAAAATASGSTYSGSVSASQQSATTVEHLPILGIQKSGPATAEAGTSASYPLSLSNGGGATAAGLTVTDALPDGSSGTVTGAPSSMSGGETGSATATYAIPAGQAAGPLADTASVTWKDQNGNGYGPVSSSYTTQVTSSFQGATLNLRPTSAGPDVVGTTQTLTASFLDTNGNPIANQPISFSLTGANPQSATETTGSSGVATFTYTGRADGSDTVQASFTVGGLAVQSNTASVGWITPVASVSTTSITGTFYAGGCGYFCANVADPLWTQSFPTIDFNPPAGSIPDNITGVNVDTRPFTDVTTNTVGDFTGTIVAEGGDSLQAGVGSLYGFDAAFTATMVVAQAGDMTFNFYDDDGFILGIGGGATPVSGTLVNQPIATAVDGYPVMGAYNDPTSPAGHQVTVDFPSAGVYPYEVDYSECCGGQLALTMATSNGEGVPPAGNLSITPVNVPTQDVGQTAQLTVAAMDASGAVIPNLPITMTVSGPNEQVVQGVTGADGLAVLAYVGDNPGTDLVVAGASVDGMPATSNTASVSWAYAVGSSSTAPPPAITNPAPADGSVVTSPVPITASFSPPAGQTITAWSVTYQKVDPTPPTTLASGTGTPPSTLATFDPTMLPNGTYTITISATDSGGGTQVLPITVAVAGKLKLGRYQATYEDLSVPVDGFQMTVDRTYDSINKEVGDFGVGWQVSLSNFTVSTNRVLGAGGWTEYPTSCILGLCFWGFKASTSHFVTVTWPDGHQEMFNFTPSGGAAILYEQGTAAYTAVPGTDTTSTLQPMPADQGVNYGFDGNLYNGSGGLYDPTEFLLTTRSGEQIVLSTQTGLVSETEPDGDSLSVDSTGVHASDGESLVFTRDGDGRITQISGPTGQTLSYSYSAAGDLATSTDVNGHVTTYAYDANHDLLTATGPGGQAEQTLTYDSAGRLASVTDADGTTTAISDNVAGRQQTVADPNGQLTTVYTYDALGDVVREDRAFSGQTLTDTWTYDANGNVLSHTDPLGHTTSATYDPAGDLTSFTDANGNATSFAYNSFGEATNETGASGAELASESYDALGNLVSTTNADGAVTSYTYDSAGHVLSVTDPDGNTEHYTYDANGNVSSVTDASGHTTTLVNDADGNTTSVSDAVGGTTKYAYDADGNVTSMTDADGHTTTFTYNGFDLLASETDPDGHTSSYTYDGAGRPSSFTDADGNVVTYSYNADGAVTAITPSTGSPSTFTYDPVGRMTQADDADGTVAFTYDAAGDITSQTSGPTATSAQPTATLSYAYDPAGNLTSMTGPAGTTGYAYDDLSQLTSLTAPTGGGFGFSYDPAGQLTGLTRPNGVDDALTYDLAGNLTGKTSAEGSTTVASLAYTYTPAELTASMRNASGTSTYGYDPANELTSASHPASGPAAESYTYDPAGNRTSSMADPSATVDPADELTADSQATYTDNGDGEVTSETARATGATTTYTWNAFGQLTAIHDGNGTSTTYRYDALGRRIEVDANGQTTRYVYNGTNIALEYNGSNALVASYTDGLGDNAPLEMVRSGQPYYYLTDAEGSVTALTSASGSVVDTYTYDTFGNQTATGTVVNPVTYTGQQYDATSGLYYYGARYYDPSTGRFLSEDPLFSPNPYAYVGNDPTNFVDPTGAQDLVENAEITASEAPEVASGIDTGDVAVYTSLDDLDSVNYVGITNNIERRGAEQVAERGINIQGIPGLQNLSRADARSVEQVLIERYGLGRDGGPLLNRINSIAPSNPLYASAIARGSYLLALVGL
jgi:RHS repeat-associated protein/uncharacterized repeat protein (TIGR01451 family)